MPRGETSTCSCPPPPELPIDSRPISIRQTNATLPHRRWTDRNEEYRHGAVDRIQDASDRARFGGRGLRSTAGRRRRASDLHRSRHRHDAAGISQSRQSRCRGRSGTAQGRGRSASDRARRTAEGFFDESIRRDRAAAGQRVGDHRHDIAVRRDRPSGERSGHRPDAVLRQRHFASADGPGRRSGRGADPSRGRAIRLHRRIGRRLCRHACVARQSVRCVGRRVDPRGPGDARHDRARRARASARRAGSASA